VVTKQISGGDVIELELVTKRDRLRTLADAGRTEEDERHLGDAERARSAGEARLGGALRVPAHSAVLPRRLRPSS
jgi:hypothetical protein